MTVIRNSVVLRCAPEDAFDYLSDLRAELEWNPACRIMDKLTDGPVGLGTRYRAKWDKSPVVELEIVAFDRPHTWTAHNLGAIEVTFSCTLTAAPGGTRLETEFVPVPHGWFRLVFPFFVLLMRREERANMSHIRAALERRVGITAST